MPPNIISVALVVIPTLCYGGIAINEIVRKNWPMAITFIGYCFANFGFIIALWR